MRPKINFGRHDPVVVLTYASKTGSRPDPIKLPGKVLASASVRFLSSAHVHVHHSTPPLPPVTRWFPEGNTEPGTTCLDCVG